MSDSFCHRCLSKHTTRPGDWKHYWKTPSNIKRIQFTFSGGNQSYATVLIRPAKMSCTVQSSLRSLIGLQYLLNLSAVTSTTTNSVDLFPLATLHARSVTPEGRFCSSGCIFLQWDSKKSPGCVMKVNLTENARSR